MGGLREVVYAFIMCKCISENSLRVLGRFVKHFVFWLGPTGRGGVRSEMVYLWLSRLEDVLKCGLSEA